MKAMNYKIELDVSEQKLSLVLEFLKGVSFIKNVRTVAPNEITNPKVLESIEDFETGLLQPVSRSLTEVKLLQSAPDFLNPESLN
jgi:hypothetical protein